MPVLDQCLAVADACLCLFVFFPLAVFHWRGTWQLQDVYFLPGNLVDSSWVSLAIGANLGLVELLTQPYLGGAIHQEHKVLYFICSRLHLYIHGWAVMCFWRGVWNLLDIYLSEGWVNSLIILTVCQVISFVTRTTRTNVGIPVSIMLDTDPDLLEPDTVFKISPEDSIRYMLDCLFTQFIIIFSSICIWRGIWNIFDIFLLPSHHFMSDVISLLIGGGAIGLMFLLQPPLAWISERLEARSAMHRLIYEDALFLVATWANLLLWRGAWDLCIEYFLPDPEVGSWVCHWLGTIGMMSLQVFNNVGLNGIERDGQYVGGEGIFPIYYLRIYLQDRIQIKAKAYKKICRAEEEDTVPMLDTSSNDNHSSCCHDDAVEKTYSVQDQPDSCAEPEPLHAESNNGDEQEQCNCDSGIPDGTVNRSIVRKAVSRSTDAQANDSFLLDECTVRSSHDRRPHSESQTTDIL